MPCHQLKLFRRIMPRADPNCFLRGSMYATIILGSHFVVASLILLLVGILVRRSVDVSGGCSATARRSSHRAAGIRSRRRAPPSVAGCYWSSRGSYSPRAHTVGCHRREGCRRVSRPRSRGNDEPRPPHPGRPW